MIDKFCLSPLVVCLSPWLRYSHKRSYKKWKDISSYLHFLSTRLSYAACDYLTFITQYSKILFPS